MKKTIKLLSFLTAVLILFAGSAKTAFALQKYNPDSKNLKPGFYKLENAKNSHDVLVAVRAGDKLFIVGGGSTVKNQASIDILDLNTFKFQKNLPVPVYNHYNPNGAVLLNDGRILLRNDNEDDDNPISSFETYDFTTNTFTDTGVKLKASCFGGMYKTKSGNVAVYCGNYETMNVYNPKTNKFLPPVKKGQKGYIKRSTAASLQDKSVYVNDGISPMIHLADKKMIIMPSIYLPAHIKKQNLKTYNDIIDNKGALVPLDGKDSKKVYVFIYE